MSYMSLAEIDSLYLKDLKMCSRSIRYTYYAHIECWEKLLATARAYHPAADRIVELEAENAALRGDYVPTDQISG